MSFLNEHHFITEGISKNYEGSYSESSSILSSSHEQHFGSSVENDIYFDQFRHQQINYYQNDFDIDDLNDDRRSFCSTCRSEDLTESEGEDAAHKWPWISDIQENGDLMYIQSYQQHKHNKNGNRVKRSTHTGNENNKEQGIQGKLKSAIKKSRSFSKKDVIDKTLVLRRSFSEKINNQNKVKTTEEFQTETNDGIPLVCKNVIINLREKVQDSFANLENVIGIISGLDFDPILDDFDDNILMNKNTRYDSNVIIVQGIIPNSPAGEKEINIGDIILAINGIKVTSQTVNSVIEQINGTKEVNITIERIAHDVEAEKPSDLCSIISNISCTGNKNLFNAFQETCAFACLALNSSEDDIDDDILFWYPDSKKSNILRSFRGIFSTLSDIMLEVLNEKIKSSVLFISDEKINVVYSMIGDKILFAAVPSKRCDLLKLAIQTKEFVEFLMILNGDLTRSFSQENMPSTKHKVALFMEMLIQRKPIVPFSGIRQLQLSVKNQVEISNVLSDAEAADYGECVDDFFPHQRLYSTIGTCLFYKDNLVCSHLTKDVFNDVILFCKYHWLFLLARTEKLKKVVIWKEISLRKAMDNQGNLDFQKPPSARWFLLVVGQNHSLFVTLLETGGAASIPEGNPGPHPYYVDTAWSILNYLNESLEYDHISKMSLNGLSVPAIVHPNAILNSKVTNPRAIQLVKRRVSVPLSNNDYTTGGVLSEEIDEPFRHERATSELSGRNSTLQTNQEYPVHDRSFSMASQDVCTNAALSTKVTAGWFNKLHYFTILSNANGVFVSPNPLKNVDRFSGGIFRRYTLCCKKIHEWFSQYQGEISNLLEYGVLFDLKSTKGAEIKKGLPNISFWVIGRKIRKKNYNEEIYVCVQDGTPQNIIELAFKARFGCYY